MYLKNEQLDEIIIAFKKSGLTAEDFAKKIKLSYSKVADVLFRPNYLNEYNWGDRYLSVQIPAKDVIKILKGLGLDYKKEINKAYVEKIRDEHNKYCKRNKEERDRKLKLYSESADEKERSMKFLNKDNPLISKEVEISNTQSVNIKTKRGW